MEDRIYDESYVTADGDVEWITVTPSENEPGVYFICNSATGFSRSFDAANDKAAAAYGAARRDQCEKLARSSR